MVTPQTLLATGISLCFAILVVPLCICRTNHQYRQEPKPITSIQIVGLPQIFNRALHFEHQLKDFVPHRDGRCITHFEQKIKNSMTNKRRN